MSKKELETAVNNYVKNATRGDTFPTGWVVLASLAPAEGSNDSDSYITVQSEGMPLHSIMGLVEVAQNDMRNSMMLSAIGRTVGMLFGEDDEDDES